MTDMKKLSMIIVLIVFVLCASIPVLAQDVTSKEYLSKVAEEVNKQLKVPVMVDEDTRLDRIEAFDKELKYNYAVVRYSVDDLDVDKFMSIVRPFVRDTVCGNETIKKDFLTNGVAITFSYVDKNNKFIGKETITQTQCHN